MWCIISIIYNTTYYVFIPFWFICIFYVIYVDLICTCSLHARILIYIYMFIFSVFFIAHSYFQYDSSIHLIKTLILINQTLLVL